MAVVIFGGLLSATVLDTLLTPLLFARLGRAPLENCWRRPTTPYFDLFLFEKAPP